MTHNHLNLLEFLLYLELLFALIMFVQAVIIPLPIGIVSSLFNIVSYKEDAFILYSNILFTIIEIGLIKILIAENSIGQSILYKIGFYLGGLFILIVNQLIHRKSVYELAIKENDFLLKYTSRKFFKLTNWLYPLIFIVIVFVPYDIKNPVSDGIFSLLNWLFHIKYIGASLPLVSGLLLLGSITYGIFFLFNFGKIKRAFDEDFYNDVLNG